jgi:ABC-type transport system involved in cytochrome c biogenesis permease subunit
MRLWIHRLGSLRIAIILLILILSALAAATIVEALHGTPAAQSLVYHALWFQTLLGLLGLNIVCSLIDLWPWGPMRIGFALTHGSILIVLAGAFITDHFKLEGQLRLWEGESSSVYSLRPDDPSQSPRQARLPFSVRLDAFEIDVYPGTRRPAMFRSRVTVSDQQRSGQAYVIEMNHELSYAGYKLFQSSYQQTPERDQSVLTVSHDPGQGVVFAGYWVLLLGMLTVLGTRILQRRMRLQIGPAPSRPGAAGLTIGLLLLACALQSGTSAAASLADSQTTETLRRLPVQHDGRVMPLDTVAREAVFNVTGQRRWPGTDPVALVLGWAFDPNGWAHEPLVQVGGAELRRAAGLAGETHASFAELVNNQRILDLIRQARAQAEREEPLPPLLSQAQKLEDRLIWMQEFLERSILRVEPARDPNATWAVPAHLHSISDLLQVQKTSPPPYVSTQRIGIELNYNRVRPARLAWWILVAASLVALLALKLDRIWLDRLAAAGLVAGLAVMSWGLWARWQIAGRIPASNIYESLLFLGWGVAGFALVVLIFLRSRVILFNAATMAGLTMALADCLPIDPFVHPMPPALSGTPWLAIHVPIIMLSYSVLALGVLVAHMQIGCHLFLRRPSDLPLRLSDLLYWYIQIGSLLLIAGIVTGSIWGASSWGRYWGWDPKEVWSLVAFLAYLAILHARMDRWIGPFGVAAWSIVAFWTIVMTYLGVNFVLATGLHSYGFGGSGVVRWMTLIGLLEGAFLAAAYWKRKPTAVLS